MSAKWAQANGLETRWLQRDESIQLSSAATKAVLKADAREASINGVQVWLSFPVVRFSGGLWVSPLDLSKTLLPLLSPRARQGEKVISICLDPGHGGRDPGNQAGFSQEKKLTLLLAKELRGALARAGFKTILTRSTDRFIELPDRAAQANRRKADLFLCLHFNSAVTSRSSVQGAEVYCLTPAGANSTNSHGDGGDVDRRAGNRNDERNVLLAWHIQKALTRGVAVEDRGVRRARFAVLRDLPVRDPHTLVQVSTVTPAQGESPATTAAPRSRGRTCCRASSTPARGPRTTLGPR